MYEVYLGFLWKNEQGRVEHCCCLEFECGNRDDCSNEQLDDPWLRMAFFKAINKTCHANFFHSRTYFNCFNGAPLGLSGHCAQLVEGRSAK